MQIGRENESKEREKREVNGNKRGRGREGLKKIKEEREKAGRD